jgi:hypothetical protein
MDGVAYFCNVGQAMLTLFIVLAESNFDQIMCAGRPGCRSRASRLNRVHTAQVLLSQPRGHGGGVLLRVVLPNCGARTHARTHAREA